MCEEAFRGQGKDHPRGLQGTIPGAHTSLGILPVTHQTKQTNKQQIKNLSKNLTKLKIQKSLRRVNEKNSLVRELNATLS